jgi:hypothetical protein
VTAAQRIKPSHCGHVTRAAKYLVVRHHDNPFRLEATPMVIPIIVMLTSPTAATTATAA